LNSYKNIRTKFKISGNDPFISGSIQPNCFI